MEDLGAYIADHFGSVRLQCSADAQDRAGRGLVALQSFQPGDVLFTETPLLHTCHPAGKDVQSDRQSGLPLDWQRLLAIYAYRRAHGEETAQLDALFQHLSTASVTSPLSHAVDPTKQSDHARDARHWVKKWKETRKKREARRKKRQQSQAPTEEAQGSDAWQPQVDEMTELLAILDTNSHSRNEADEFDLQHPLVETAPETTDKKEEEALQSLFNESQDEACGVWLVASMMNHSCLPNCTVDIPSQKRSKQSGGVYPSLVVRCLRPIQPGDELLISYHDEEIMPAADRQALMLAKGFNCACPLCAAANQDIPDRSRCAVCTHCDTGLVIARKNEEKQEMWLCDQCGQPANPKMKDLLVKKEDQWMKDWETGILKMVMGQAHAPFMAVHLLKAIAALQPRLYYKPENNVFDGESLLKQLQKTSTLKMAPMSVCHAYVYAFLKFILFEQSVWLRRVHGNDGIDGVLHTMLAIVQRVSLHLDASDEYRKLCFWVTKQADEHMRSASPNTVPDWSIVRHRALHQWEKGMKMMYGAPPTPWLEEEETLLNGKLE